MKRRERVRLGHPVMPDWMDAQLFGKARWLRDHPKRYHLLVRAALDKIGLPYYCNPVMWNDNWQPTYKGTPMAGGYQIIDYLLRVRGAGVLAIMLDNHKYRQDKFKKHRWQTRLDELKQRGVPTLVLPIHLSTQEYWIIISNWIRKEKTNATLKR